MTNSSFTRMADHLDHGEFTNPFSPPQNIELDHLAEWRAESNGILTGTEGGVDYRIDNSGDGLHLSWDNPAVGNTFFGFSTERPDGRPSDFVFFPIHIGFDGSIAPDPVLGSRLVAMMQGDLGDEAISTVLPFPLQAHLMPHAWFDIGIRNRREPINLSRWLKALNIKSPADLHLKRFSLRELVALT